MHPPPCLLKPSTKGTNSAILVKSTKVRGWVQPTEGDLLSKHGGLIISPFRCTTSPSHIGHLVLMANAVPVSHLGCAVRGNLCSPGPSNKIQEGALRGLLAASSSSLLVTTCMHQSIPHDSFSLSSNKDSKVALPAQPTKTSSLLSWPLGLLLAFPYSPALKNPPQRESLQLEALQAVCTHGIQVSKAHTPAQLCQPDVPSLCTVNTGPWH